MMDCVVALSIVSDAIDNLEVDSALLVDAKDHCRNCPECRSFVKAMLAVRSTPHPSHSDDLADRIMATVRAEAKAAAIARTRAIASPGVPEPVTAEKPASPGPELAAPAERTSVVARLADPRNRRVLAAWMGAAAAVFILAGWGAVLGMRSILVPNQPLEYEFVGQSGDTAMTQAAPESGSDSRALSAAPKADDSAQAPAFITFDGKVYRIVGEATPLERNSLERVGTTTTQLDGRVGTRAEVFSESGVLYVENDGVLMSLERLDFNYAGIMYTMQSAPIETLGSWPTLPNEIREPLSADGAPTFEPHSDSDSVYVLRGRTPAEGIALPPNPGSPAQLVGCPNWTWWLPAR